ncbi:MAG: hypothetical protein HQ483_11645 [Rhodospirillales bacterium]|nr:hypothetical protein [Rhodospirillales bacterium]
MAAASEPLVLVQQAEVTSNEIEPGRILAVGAGIVVGAVTFMSVFNFPGAGLVGGVTGGLVSDWWYGDRYDYAELERK